MSPADPQRVRDTILRAVARRPGIGQAELASRVATATRAPQTAVVGEIRALEREGLLAARRVDRRKAYEIPAASPLELARKAEIERIVAAAPPPAAAAAAPPVTAEPPGAAAPPVAVESPDAAAPPVAKEHSGAAARLAEEHSGAAARLAATEPAAAPAAAGAAARARRGSRSSMPAWAWALVAVAGLVWNVLLARLVAGD